MLTSRILWSDAENILTITQTLKKPTELHLHLPSEIASYYYDILTMPANEYLAFMHNKKEWILYNKHIQAIRQGISIGSTVKKI